MTHGNGRLHIVGVGSTVGEDSTSVGALRRALVGAEQAGAETELLGLRGLKLPFYEPGKPLEEYGPEVEGSSKRYRRLMDYLSALLHIVGRWRVSPRMPWTSYSSSRRPSGPTWTAGWSV
jgi:hypothetical protein